MSTENMNIRPPITEDDLHALVDGQLDEARAREVQNYVNQHPEQARRLQAWQTQRNELRALYAPVLDEPIPTRLKRVARSTGVQQVWRLAAALAIALTSGLIGWSLRGQVTESVQTAAVAPSYVDGLAQRAAVAHAVYVPDQRRPVEIGAAHQDQLVTWLSKRMGAAMNPPDLASLGYQLQGGRLLPGGRGPVAQFMYEDASGLRLTLYVSNENPGAAPSHAPEQAAHPSTTAFQFAQDGAVNVFYWVDGPFGYALSSYAGRTELARVSAEVYKQLTQDLPS